jgi:hypothetical protein
VEGKNPKKIEGIPKSAQQSRTSLCSRRNDRPDEIEAVDCSGHAVERRDFPRQRVHAKCFGAGSDKDGRAALFFARKREGEFNVRPRIKRNVGMEEDTATGDVAKLARMEVGGTVPRQANLDR